MQILATTELDEMLTGYKAAAEEELDAILWWWAKYMPDERGGFYGSVNNANEPDHSAQKAVVLNSRILWTFSAAYRCNKNESYLIIAQRAFEYIIEHFVDHEYGGVYWSVDAWGKKSDERKQVYGQAFCIYGMAEYYKVTGNELALQLSKDLFDHIEQYSFDNKKDGYIEAFTREWQPASDLRLSEKDMNEKKTMNTHLHIIEAYANLYSVWPDPFLREKIAGLLELFDRYFISKKDQHLHLFMDENWELKSSMISFGHDIEAAWLLLECAGIIRYELYTHHYKPLSIALANAAARGRDVDGALWCGYDPAHGHWIKEKHFWPQAEAMVGFFSAWQLTNEPLYLQYSLEAFDFIKAVLRDQTHGEWFWGVHENGSLMEKEKAGFWKCPYHNARACMEISKRIVGLRA